MPGGDSVLSDISKGMVYLKKKSLKGKIFNVDTEKVRIQYFKTWIHACNSYLTALKDVELDEIKNELKELLKKTKLIKEWIMVNVNKIKSEIEELKKQIKNTSKKEDRI